MLSAYHQKQVWEGMLGAEIRANYFADLSGRFALRQKAATWVTLVLTSSAAGAVLADLPAAVTWIRGTLALAAAAISAYSLVMQNQKVAVDASDLHARWNRLAGEYARLWGNIYGPDAVATLEKLQQSEEELSKPGVALPYRKRLLEKWETHVIAHHKNEMAPA